MLYTVDLDPPSKGNENGFPGLDVFTRRFEKGVAEYIAGEWRKAAAHFQRCLSWWPEDEPTRALLWFMSRKAFLPPEDWEGHRPL